MVFLFFEVSTSTWSSLGDEVQGMLSFEAPLSLPLLPVCAIYTKVKQTTRTTIKCSVIHWVTASEYRKFKFNPKYKKKILKERWNNVNLK